MALRCPRRDAGHPVPRVLQQQPAGDARRDGGPCRVAAQKALEAVRAPEGDALRYLHYFHGLFFVLVLHDAAIGGELDPPVRAVLLTVTLSMNLRICRCETSVDRPVSVFNRPRCACGTRCCWKAQKCCIEWQLPC